MDAHSLEKLDFQRIRELLAGFALTGLGRTLAGTIHPIARSTLVQRWLDQVRELQGLALERGLPPLAGVTDVREVVERCAPPLRVNVEEMARVGDALAATHAIAAYLRDLPADMPELAHLAGRVGDFQVIAERIGRVLDDRGQVRDDASPKLAGIRRQIAEAGQQIASTVERLIHDPGVRRVLQYPNHTFHGDRLVLPLRSECRGRLPGIVHRTSDSGATLYVEPAAVVELNNHISNLRAEEQEEIGRLLWDLAHEVHLNAAEIRRTLDTLAVLDLIAAKVRFAREFGLRCPALGADGSLQVREARHPLLIDLLKQKQAAGEASGEVVPIDFRIGSDFKLLIITGPNTGGKTVTLKTIGLLCLMLQAGLPVPVGEGSQFGLFTNVLIDVGDEQSLQQSLSTFSAHIVRVVDMLRHAGPHALLLIDELGAGTDPDEGAALGRAILDEMLRLDTRGVVTTHLGALKGFALTRPGAENACVEFDPQTLRPTYRLLLGEPGASNAIEVAARLGLSRRLINAARRNVSRKGRALNAAIESTRAVKRQAEDARRQAEEAQLQAGKAASAAEEARTHFERQKVDFQQWLQRVVHLQPGDAVRVREFDRDGRIVRMRLDQQRAEVDVGAFSVEVPLGDVLPPQTPPPPPRPPRPVIPPSMAPRPRRPREGGEGGRSAGAARPAGGVPRGAGAGAPPRPGSERRDEARGERRRDEDREERPRPVLPSISREQALTLQPLDAVYVKRFHREGRVVRIKAAKDIAVVNVGMLEVEVPFDGLAMPPQRPAVSRPAPPRKPPAAPAAETAPAPVVEASAAPAAAASAAPAQDVPNEPPVVSPTPAVEPQVESPPPV